MSKSCIYIHFSNLNLCWWNFVKRNRASKREFSKLCFLCRQSVSLNFCPEWIMKECHVWCVMEMEVWDVAVSPSIFLLRMYRVPFSEGLAWFADSKVHGKDSMITDCCCLVWCIFLQSFPLCLRWVAPKQTSQPHPVFLAYLHSLFQIVKHIFPMFLYKSSKQLRTSAPE